MVFVTEQWMLVSLLLLLAAAFVFFEGKKGGQNITHHEVSRLLNSDAAVLVDVRDGAEFKAGHITGALNIPHASLATRIAELEKFKDKQVILADKMGQHAGHAGKVLRDAGYNVVRLQGGMSQWLSLKLPVVKPGKGKK
jgi:rhodanese-related sulfurtransferase